MFSTYKRLNFDFFRSRMQYESLFGMVSSSSDVEGLYKQRPDVWRNSLGFYYGHTVAFTRSKLIEAGADLDRHEFDDILQRGVSPDSPDEIDSKQDFPSVKDMSQYKNCFEKYVNSLLSEEYVSDDVLYALRLGIEHERLHLQTSIPLITQLSDSYKIDSIGFNQSLFKKVDHVYDFCVGGEIRLGVDVKDGKFHWDNEIGNKVICVEPFTVAKYPITIGDVIDFINIGGYSDEWFWDSSGVSLDWFRKYSKGMPFNIELNNDGYRFKSVHKSISFLPLSLPASLNAYEADAIAKFMGGRCISEAEFVLLNQNVDPYNYNFKQMKPDSVLSHDSYCIGNQAIWTCDDFMPLCGIEEFTEQKLYNGFSSEWFGNGHRVIKGCSFVGTGDVMTSPYFRDFMQNVIGYCATTYVVKP